MPTCFSVIVRFFKNLIWRPISNEYLKEVAVHEAGHAVVAHHLGYEVERIIIPRRHQFRGSYCAQTISEKPTQGTMAFGFNYVLDEISILLAGEIAQDISKENDSIQNIEGCHHDKRQARKMARDLVIRMRDLGYLQSFDSKETLNVEIDNIFKIASAKAKNILEEHEIGFKYLVHFIVSNEKEEIPKEIIRNILCPK